MINAISFYRASRWCYLHHIPIIPQIMTLFIFLIYNSKIPYKAKIGKKIKCGYGGIGVVIHSDSVIGDNCIIGQHVTIGGGNLKYPGVPIIGKNVVIYHGAIVFGGITIGDNVVIGANSVVNKNIQDNAICAGVPVKIIRIKEEI